MTTTNPRCPREHLSSSLASAWRGSLGERQAVLPQTRLSDARWMHASRPGAAVSWLPATCCPPLPDGGADSGIQPGQRAAPSASTSTTPPPGPDPRRTYGREHLAAGYLSSESKR